MLSVRDIEKHFNKAIVLDPKFDEHIKQRMRDEAQFAYPREADGKYHCKYCGCRIKYWRQHENTQKHERAIEQWEANNVPLR